VPCRPGRTVKSWDARSIPDRPQVTLASDINGNASVSYRRFLAHWSAASPVPARSGPEEQKQRLANALERKGVSPTEASELVERMWPVLDAILDAVGDVRVMRLAGGACRPARWHRKPIPAPR
jgi:hypothetical protein